MKSRSVAERRSKPADPEIDLDTLVANAREASEFLKALAHETRLMILCLLADGEKSVTAIEQTLSLRQPAISGVKDIEVMRAEIDPLRRRRSCGAKDNWQRRRRAVGLPRRQAAAGFVLPYDMLCKSMRSRMIQPGLPGRPSS